MINDFVIERTGDPFVDAGGYVIKFLQDQPHLKDKGILDLVDFVTQVYVGPWEGKLHAFFLNSTITQNAFKGDRKREETIKFYNALLNESLPSVEGYCRISGRRASLFAAARDNHILSGSGTFINFHHSFDDGLMLSKEVLIQTFFIPFGLIQLSDKIALISSNEEKLSEYFVRQNCRANIQDLAGGLSKGVLKSPFNNPSSALFHFVEDCLRQLKNVLFVEDDEVRENAPSLTLYHFTNFGASPDINIYTMTSQVFKFYIFCSSSQFSSSWKKFIRAHYKTSKSKGVFNPETESWEGKETVTYENYKTWGNDIFERLITAKPILHYFTRWARYHPFPFKIVEVYQTLIRNMEKQTLEKIKHIADFIVGQKEAEYIEKSIMRLHRERSANGVRLFVLKMTEQNYYRGGREPLVTLEDCAEYLFPDGGNWREIRDLILIAIYERLHELNLKITLENLEDENELTTEN